MPNFFQAANTKRKSPVHNHIISPDEDMRRLFRECTMGQGNAALLSEALAHSKPEDLKKKNIIKVCHVHIYKQKVFNMAVLRNSMINVGHHKNSYVPKSLGHQPVRNIPAP